MKHFEFSGQDTKPEKEPGCLFCEELLEQQEGVVADTSFWRVVVSRDQGYLGRCMVISKYHIGNIMEMGFEQNDDLHDTQTRLEIAVRSAFSADWCNWTQLGNDALAEEVPKPHLHHHMRPRYQEPVIFAGYEFDDPNFGGMYDLNQRWNVDKDPHAAGFKDLVAMTIHDHLPTHYNLS